MTKDRFVCWCDWHLKSEVYAVDGFDDGTERWRTAEKSEMYVAEGRTPKELRVGGRQKNQSPKWKTSSAAALQSSTSIFSLKCYYFSSVVLSQSGYIGTQPRMSSLDIHTNLVSYTRYPYLTTRLIAKSTRQISHSQSDRFLQWRVVVVYAVCGRENLYG